MASENCWQVGKTLSETNRHMLQTELGADVCFFLPAEDGGTVGLILATSCITHVKQHLF